MKKWLIVIMMLILIVFFYPKDYISGGLQGGPIGPGQNAYKVENSCFGIKYSYYPKGCADCGNVYNCYGLLYNKKCYIETYSVNENLSKELTPCR